MSIEQNDHANGQDTAEVVAQLEVEQGATLNHIDATELVVAALTEIEFGTDEMLDKIAAAAQRHLYGLRKKLARLGKQIVRAENKAQREAKQATRKAKTAERKTERIDRAKVALAKAAAFLAENGVDAEAVLDAEAAG